MTRRTLTAALLLCAALVLALAACGGGDDEVRERYRQAAPPDQLWLGLERYWRKRREREDAAA